MFAFDRLLCDEIETAIYQKFFMDYVGQAVWHITTIKHAEVGTENDMPQYAEIISGEKANEPSADEIIAGVLKKLR